MKRFVDLRGQETGYRFAFWDTVYDRFDTFEAVQAWDTFAEFEQDCTADIERYRRLTPEWAFVPPAEE